MLKAGGIDTVPISVPSTPVVVTLVASMAKDNITIVPFLVVLLSATVTPVAGVNISVPELAVKSLLVFNSNIGVYRPLTYL
jgi:hypothetical protein